MSPLLTPLAALLLSPAFGQTAPSAFAEPDQQLLQDLDPDYADSFLTDDSLRAYLRQQDAGHEASLVEQATRLKDLKDLLLAQTDPGGLNAALRARLVDDPGLPDVPKGLGFGSQPEKLVAWTGRYMPGVSEDVLDEALYEWSTLSPAQQRWLAAPGRAMTGARWAGTPFDQRANLLHEWGSGVYQRLLSASPKTRAELDALGSQGDSVLPVLSSEERSSLQDAFEKDQARVKGLAELSAKAATIHDPRLLALLHTAQTGSTDDALAAMSQLFDKTGIQDRSVVSMAPSAADQKLSSLDPSVVKSMIGTAVLQEIQGVPAGQRVYDFFQTHPLKLAMSTTLGPSALAEYDHETGEIQFSGQFVDDFLKGEGVKPADLARRPDELKKLAMIMAPTFVHESTHQMQDDWAKQNHVEFWSGQHLEIEAKEVQSLFLIEKARADPAYAQFLKENQDHSQMVREDLFQASAFERDPRGFRELVMTDYYDALPSLEADAADAIGHAQGDVQAVSAELARRKALPPSQVAAIDADGYDKDADFDTMAEWGRYLRGVKTSALNGLQAKFAADRASAETTYDKTSAREESQYDSLEAELAATEKGSKTIGEPPPPPSGSSR